MKLNKDFYIGYSPERVSPGDKVTSQKLIRSFQAQILKAEKIVFSFIKKLLRQNYSQQKA